MDRRNAHLFAGGASPLRPVLYRSYRSSTGGLRRLKLPAIIWFSLDDERWDLDELREVLPPDELARCGRLISPLHQRRQTIACALLRQLLAPLVEQQPLDLCWQRGEHGKPQLFGSDTLHFNLTHSEGYAALGVASSGELGLDIEYRRRRVDWQALAPRFFAAPEAELVMNASNGQHLFFDVWTAKEAYIKALGDGLTHPLDRFLTTDGSQWRLTDLQRRPLDWVLQRPRCPWPDVVSAWASKDPQIPYHYLLEPGGSPQLIP